MWKAGLDSVEPFPSGMSCSTSSPGPVDTPRSKVLFPVMSIVFLMLGLTSCCSSDFGSATRWIHPPGWTAVTPEILPAVLPSALMRVTVIIEHP